MTKQGKTRSIILGAAAVGAAAAGIAAGRRLGKDRRTLAAAFDSALEILEETHDLTAVDPGPYGVCTLYGVLRFPVRQFTLEGVGNLSVMTAHVGPMAMETLTITPLQKDVPLMAADYLVLPGRRKAYVEFFDLTASPDPGIKAALEALTGRCDDLADFTAAPSWYDELMPARCLKQGRPRGEGRLAELLLDSVRTYLAVCDAAPALAGPEAADKGARTREYVENLVKRGGTSTQIFTSAWGADRTLDFLKGVFFGTDPIV